MIEKLLGREAMLLLGGIVIVGLLLLTIHALFIFAEFWCSVAVVSGYAAAAAYRSFWEDLATGHAELLFSLPVARRDHLTAKLLVGLGSIVVLAAVTSAIGESRVFMLLWRRLNPSYFQMLVKWRAARYAWNPTIVAFPTSAFLLVTALSLKMHHRRMSGWSWGLCGVLTAAMFPWFLVLESWWLRQAWSGAVFWSIYSVPPLLLAVGVTSRFGHWIETRQIG